MARPKRTDRVYAPEENLMLEPPKLPPLTDSSRDRHGGFMPGHRTGEETRFKKGTHLAPDLRRHTVSGKRAIRTRQLNKPINDLVRDLHHTLIRTVTPEDVRDMTLAIIDKAKSGDVFAFREVMDRTIGKVTQSMDIKTDGKPLKAYIGIDLDNV